jgi:hypothetical protein
MIAYAKQEVRLVNAVLAAQVAERLWIASGVIDPAMGFAHRQSVELAEEALEGHLATMPVFAATGWNQVRKSTHLILTPPSSGRTANPTPRHGPSRPLRQGFN